MIPSSINTVQKWKKLGCVFAPNGHYSWMQTHAANPFAKYLYDDIFRIYFNCRDKNNRSSIGFLEVDINMPFKILRISDKSILSFGEVGTFDDSGVSLSCILTIGDKKYLYYVGWNLGVTVPWRNSIGLATSEDGENFTKYKNVPIVDRNEIDPYSLSYPYVLVDSGKFKMWYGSNLQWGKSKTDMMHVIKYAKSNDGINWYREGQISIGFKSEDEYAISRPCVIKEGNIYKMWYSYRGDSYKIGYAESIDGINWQRKDKDVGLNISDSPLWDSEMITYPFIFDHRRKRYMLYNGNSYGKTGFGLAILEE